MADTMSVRINDREVEVAEGTTVAVALMIAGSVRRSVTGEARGPLCGMGICFECRATVDGHPQRRTCQMPCRPGMEVTTDGR